jgi:hypothetical protein
MPGNGPPRHQEPLPELRSAFWREAEANRLSSAILLSFEFGQEQSIIFQFLLWPQRSQVMDSYRYEDFDEHNMTCSIRDHGELEIRLSNAQSKAFDYMLSRYLRKKPSEVAKYYGLMHSSVFFST